MVVVTRTLTLGEIDIPETWDIIKYKNPIHPTYSRGKVGTYSFSNNKYHCYRIVHSNPTYELMPYRATGFGFAERNCKYIPLTHVQDRSGGKKENILSRKSQMMKVYESAIDEIKQRQEINREFKIRRESKNENTSKDENNYTKVFEKFEKDIESINGNDAMIADVKYRTHQINRLVRNYNDSLK